MSLLENTIAELHIMICTKQVSIPEITKSSLDTIKATEDKVKAFLRVDEKRALEQAELLQEDQADLEGNQEMGLLDGMPAGIKDNICTVGMETTCASKILKGYIPPYEATVMQRITAAGAVTIGKTNMDEFAMGSSTENSSIQVTRNPWHLDFVPGGSSGGSAASVAAGQVAFALGSDTGGSIRQPAAYCGVVGMKPTYGRVSRYGLVAYASSLDQIGPLTRTVEDCATVLQVLSGYDDLDSTSAQVVSTFYQDRLSKGVRGTRIAVAKEYMGAGIQAGVRAAIEKAIVQYTEMGAIVEEVSLPHTDYALPCYYLLAAAEASSNLARYDGIKYGMRAEGVGDLLELYKKTRSQGFGDEVKRRIMLGTYALSSGYYDAYYLKAQKVRTLIKQDFDNVFQNYDLIIGPTAPTTAFRIGEQVDDPLTMYMNDICTIPVNLAGLPAISVPCGFDKGMPVGLQIIGKAFAEAQVLQAAYAFEQANNYYRQRPQFKTDNAQQGGN